MAKHEPDPNEDAGGPYPGNWPDTRKRDRDIPRALWIFLFCLILVLGAMYLVTVVALASLGRDPQPLIDSVSSVDGIIPTVITSLVLVVQFVTKRQQNRVEALAGREGPSAIHDELAAVKEALADLQGRPSVPTGPVAVVQVAAETPPEPAAYVPPQYAQGGIVERPAVVDPYASLPQDRATWAERTTPAYDLDEAPPAPTRPGRRQAVDAWDVDVADLQEAPPARRWAPRG